MVVLTSPQAKDLRYLVALFRLTIGITRTRRAVGDSVRTGRVLAQKGLVEPAPIQFSNRAGTWVPSRMGLEYVETNYPRFDEFSEVAVERAVDALRGALR